MRAASRRASGSTAPDVPAPRDTRRVDAMPAQLTEAGVAERIGGQRADQGRVEPQARQRDGDVGLGAADGRLEIAVSAAAARAPVHPGATGFPPDRRFASWTCTAGARTCAIMRVLPRVRQPAGQAGRIERQNQRNRNLVVAARVLSLGRGCGRRSRHAVAVSIPGRSVWRRAVRARVRRGLRADRSAAAGRRVHARAPRRRERALPRPGESPSQPGARDAGRSSVSSARSRSS